MERQKQPQIRVGYACINLSIKESFRNFRLSAVQKQDEEKITEVMWHNIRLLKKIIDYNIKHNIYVYRVSSDLIPFCTQPYVKTLYEERVLQNHEMQQYLRDIHYLQEKYQLRLSIHPSQFNVLASPKKEVVNRSIAEINEQTRWSKLLGVSNVVLHIGGSYGNKEEALRRFKANVGYVDCKLISIENDDKTYNAQEVCSLCQDLKLKWVYDYHHCRCHPSPDCAIEELLEIYPPDKYHLSTGTPHYDSRPHAELISKGDYRGLIKLLEKSNILKADVIFEAKLKNKAITAILEPKEQGYWILKGENKE